MAVKNILVAYNGLPGSEAALRGAVSMQQHYDAHLTGLFAHGGSPLSHQIQPWMPKSVQDALREVEERSYQDIRDKFQTACGTVPADKLHWIESNGPVQRTVAAYARLFDLTVVGMHEDAADQTKSHIEIYPDRVAFDSGRPVMIFPHEFEGNHFQERAAVAWDGGNAAARALSDAVQILGLRRTVEIVSVGRSPLDGALPGIDISKVLQRHDLSVTLTELPRDRRSVADILVDHCVASEIKLLVMGAYEHSPLREGLIGGVTHDISHRAKVPVLMSH